MSVRLLSVALIVGLLLLSGRARAQSSGRTQPDDSLTTLYRRHSITVGVGLLSRTQVSPGKVVANGFLGSLSYTYWPWPEWGLEVNALLLDSEVTAGATASVTSLLFGGSYYSRAFMLSPALRPYLTGAVGPYFGFETASFPRTSSRTETVLGARLGGGIDAFVGEWLRLGGRVVYHVTPEYQEALGTIRNVSGFQVSFEVGVAFGGR